MRHPLLASFLLLASGGLSVAHADGPATAVPAAPSLEEREAVRSMVAELREEASRLRGLEWKAEVPADLLTREQLFENLKQLVREDYPIWKQVRDEKTMRRIGILKEDQDSIEMLLSVLKECVAGYYEPKTKRLYIIEGETGEAQKPTMLHELIHALEDQHYDLEGRIKPIEEDPDRVFAEQCLNEGSAEVARLLYQAQNPRIAKLHDDAQNDPEMGRRQQEALEKVPLWLVLPEFLHYSVGPSLVAKYVGGDYAQGMSRLYASPPLTEEQWLHPEKWLGEEKDLPREVVFTDLRAAAGDGWSVLHGTTVGELDVNLYLQFFLGSKSVKTPEGDVPVSTIAARGWDAGRDLFLEKAGLPLIWVQAMAWDSARDAAEAAFALAEALQASSEGTFQAVGTWALSKAADGSPRARLDYRTSNGRGRILVRGDELLLADGVPESRFESVWTEIEKTRIR